VRTVSLLPSSTEAVFALGAGHGLVGRSHECDLPEGARRVPVLTSPRVDREGPSVAIDRDVRSLVERALSIYSVDVDLLRELRPDLILTQTQCDVCAVTPRDLEDALSGWVGASPRILSTEPARLADVLADLERIGAALGLGEDGRALAAELGARLARLAARTQALPERPRVACIEWIEPLMYSAHWIPELVERAGGAPAFGRAGERSARMDLEALVAADPDLILLIPCGLPLERTRRELSPLFERAAFRELRAVRERELYLVDGNRHFNRPGPRIVESLEILLEILHPEELAFGHEGSAWERLGKVY
jgi:iron complex transport system substrate-binding protein